MKLRETSECPNCKPIARRLAKLEQQLVETLQRIDKLEQENTRLRDENTQLKQQLAAARKNSSTSSKPPSSDIVKPKKPPAKGGKKRKRGGQPGHKRHEHPSFPAEMIDDNFSFSTIRKFLRDVVGIKVCRGYLAKLIQFCLAHLIRDVKFLATLPDKKQQAYGKRVREALREMFAVIHRREKLSEAGLAKKLEAARAEVFRVATTRVPEGKHAQNLAKRFHQHGDAYFRFITTPGIEPTNNLAEQAIRFVVIDRRITQGTRSETGRRWSERIWTTIATCAQQGRSAFEFLLETVESHLRGAPPPSLLPSGTSRPSFHV